MRKSVRPFLKWAGNKAGIVERIRAVLPPGNRLIEPFAGSAAVFMNTGYPKYLLSDINSDLIHLYQYLQRDGKAFIGYCRGLFTPETNNAETYYQFRELFNTTTDIRLKSALFLYFNRHGYNGLCRFNAKGGFNVPFGKYRQPYFPADEMLAFYEKSSQAVFKHQDFMSAMKAARSGDVVYCDPPYVPLSDTANFTSYSTGSFDLQAQEMLADVAQHLSKKGITVVISNHDTVFTQQVYQSATIISFQVQRYISCKGEARGKANEMLALFTG